MAISVVLFDFGGVVAEEGFREGLKAIAAKNGLPADFFFSEADRLIAESGYLTGEAVEADYWNMLRRTTGIAGSDNDLRSEIMKRFIIRGQLIRCIDLLRSRGARVFLLSDQTNWLEEIDAGTNLSAHFDGIYNSFRTHASKHDPRTFLAVCERLGVTPGQALFVDDNEGHIERASRSGLQTILYTSFDDFSERLRLLTGISCR